MSRIDRIKEKLKSLNPTYCHVIDESSGHKGHSAMAGNESAETHLTIEISSKALADKSRLDQQRAINNLIKDEFETGLHALSIKVI